MDTSLTLQTGRSERMPPKSLYEYPHFYDLAFRDETEDEADFIEAAWKRFGQGKMKHVLEPGCGSGRLVVEMAERGYRVTGFDLIVESLKYLKTRLKRKKQTAEVICGDMTDFTIRRQFDLAYCTMNTFRHLTSDDEARRHLQCVADHLREGGLYILGFHLIPPDADEECTERWIGKDRRNTVSFTLRVLDFCRRKRLETIRISMLARTPNKEVRGRTEFKLRLYKANQFKKLLSQVPDFDLLEVFDFDYDIDFPRDFDDELADSVFVLRKS